MGNSPSDRGNERKVQEVGVKFPRKPRSRHRHRNIMFSQRKHLPLGRAKINVSIIKGDLTTEKADVIVCTASKNLDLSRGRASGALLKAAGDEMQDDCGANYPNGIEYSDVAMVNPGNLPCKKVYFVALPVWGTGHKELKGLEELITKCLKEASKHNSESLALPSLGTGLLKYPADQVAQCTLDTVKSFSDQHPTTSLKYVNIIIYHKDSDSFNAFENEARSRASSSGSQNGASGSVKPKVTPIGLKSIVSRQISNGEGEDSIGSIKVHVVKGEIAKIKADVIVNNTDTSLKLDNGGMSEALLEEAGPALQEECTECFPNGIKYGDIAITSGYGLKCKEVYHGALPRWDKNKAATAQKPLCKFVCRCLKQAQKDRISSIAFPTLGTGSLDYPPTISAQTMFECIKKHQNTCANSSLTDVTIVVYDKGDRWKQIKAAFDTELRNIQESEGDDDDDEDEDNSNNVMYKFLEQAAMNSLERTMAPPKGTPDWFKHQYKTTPRPPCYWTEFTTRKALKDWLLDSDDMKPKRIPVDSHTFDTVKRITETTWQSQHVGQGRDAKGLDSLNYKSIRVTKVERIENCELYEKYALKRQELFHKAGKFGVFPSLEHLKNSSGKIMTTVNVPQNSALDLDVHPEINEHFMFHGTQDSVVDTIVKQGLDCRLGGAGAMFGQGVYAAESSTKSDQYADPISNRTKGEKKMFLIRMALGSMYVIKTAKVFARAPCMKCFEDKCSCTDNRFFDSVVGDGGWNFREFVVYDRTQVYPEYLITYVRE